MDSLLSPVLTAFSFYSICFFASFVKRVAASGPPTPVQQEEWSPSENEDDNQVRYGGVVLRKTPSREKSSESSGSESVHQVQLRKTPERSKSSKTVASRTRSRTGKVKVVDGNVADKTAYFDSLSRGSTPPMPDAEIPAHTPQARHRIAKPVLIPQEDSPLSARRGRSSSASRQRGRKRADTPSPHNSSRESSTEDSRESPKRSSSRGRGRKRGGKATTMRKSTGRGRRRLSSKESDPDYVPENYSIGGGW